MGCTVSKKKNVPTDGNPPVNNKMEQSSSGNSSKSSKRTGEKSKENQEEKKEEEKPSSTTDISKLTTEKLAKTGDASEKKQPKTLEEKSAKIPSADSSDENKKTGSNETNEKTPITKEFPCATPLKVGQKLQPPKPDNGEYINFNDMLSDDDFSDDEDKDGKKKEKKGGKKDEKKEKEGKKDEKKKEKEGKKEEKKEVKKEEKKEEKKEKEKENPKEKDQKEAKPVAVQPCLTVAPKQEKPVADRKSARSVGGKEKKIEVPKKTDGMKMHETKDAVKKMRTGAVRARNAPHEDTLYQVPHRMPEVDFTKLH